MISDLRIELARENDLAALLAATVLLTAPARQAAIVRAAVREAGCLIASSGAQFAGFVTWDRGFYDRPFVRLLAVEPAARGRGLGSALLHAVEDAVRPGGELFISTEARNAPMQALLAKLGYVPSGSIENVNEPGNAELVYHKRL